MPEQLRFFYYRVIWQFKIDAIQMYENGEKSMAQVERELGITKGLLAKWREELLQAKDQADAFPGNGNLPDSEGRLRQLERENAQLRQEKEILKKVLGIYSKDAR